MRGHLNSEACCTVKVENLSKRSNEAGLKEKLVQYGRTIKSIRIIPCADSPANFAYVNCVDSYTAKSIVSTVNKKVMLDSNLLTAKLKQGGGGALPQANHTPSARDMCTVKVLINCGSNLTEADLDQHFKEFGELSSPCKIRLGNPDYAYVNFSDPLSAQEARNTSHCVHGVPLRTVPLISGHPNRATLPQPVLTGDEFTKLRLYPSIDLPRANKAALASSVKLTADPEFVKSLFPCGSLAGHYVKDAVERYVRERSLQVKVTIQGEKICLFARKGVAIQIGGFVNSSICDNEAKICSVRELLDCCYLPVLADLSVQDQIAKLKHQVPFEAGVLADSTHTSLKQLAQTYSGQSVIADELKPFLKKSNRTDHRWYWDDESSLKPYDRTVGQKLEEAFESKLTIVVSIGRFEYRINTSRMRQTNTRTNKVRNVIRKAEAAETEERSVSLVIRGHSDHIHEVKREILDTLERHIQEVEVPITCVGGGTSVSEYLLEIARKGFVSARREGEGSSGTIILRGMLSVVRSMEVELKGAMLTRQLEAVKTLDVEVPGHWEHVERDRCTLKTVGRGSEEWYRVRQHMAGFDILRIDRIQNTWLWEVYDRSRKRMSDKNSGKINERDLFHGTRAVPPIKIYNSEQGFDNRLSSQGMWGEGAYFAVNASYSDRYAYTTPEGHKQMFLVQVITGVTYECSPDRSLKAPPKKADHPGSSHRGGAKFEDERYDSVSGHTNGSKVFIIYEHGKVYPAYLITYHGY
jgi:RNA recognition motif-containing protein